MADPLYPTFAFLGILLVLIPLPWHLQAWNAGTCLFMIWTAVGCLIHFINNIVWAGNLEVHSAPWCDISTKLIVGLSVALPCASLCINRRLYSIARLSQIHTTKAEKRRGVYIDVAIGVGIPVIVMALHYIVQGHRFDIFEDIGCWPSTVNMAPSYALVWMWPVVIGLISMVFSVLSLHAFIRRRIEFNELLSKNHALSTSRYFRLMALATIEIVTTVPLSLYFIHLNLSTEPVSPWVSWSDTKWHFSRIDVFPAWIVNANSTLKLNFTLNIWLFPGCAFMFFAFFGLAEEARRNYTRLYYRLTNPFGISPALTVPRTIRGPIKIDALSIRSHTSSFAASEQGSKDDGLLSKTHELVQYPSGIMSVSFSNPTLETPCFQNGPMDTRISTSPMIGCLSSTHMTPPLSLPTLAISHPDSDSCVISSTELQQSSALPDHPSLSHPTSALDSIADDPSISVSPAYYMDLDTAPLDHECTVSTQGSHQVSSLNSSVHGGIQITVEKYIS